MQFGLFVTGETVQNIINDPDIELYKGDGKCNLPSYDGDNVERRKKLSEFSEKMDW